VRRVARTEDGAYAILYGLLLVVLLGTAAVVVDLAAMREDRRSGRLASDSAATAAARLLDPLGDANAQQACEEAWSYVHTNLDVPVASPTNCNNFAGLTANPCPALPTVATATSENVTVTVTWPVHQDSPLLAAPNVVGDAAVTSQNLDTTVDGKPTDACARIAVQVDQVHEQSFASIFGAEDKASSATSVARALTVPGGEDAIAALNVLNETSCQAIHTSGQGYIRINAVGARSGIVSVESSGRQTAGGACPNNMPWVIHAADNNAGAYVRADGPGGAGQGIIYSYALNPSPKGNPTQAFDPTLVPPGNTLLMPRPTLLTKRVGDQPVRDIYDCSGSCDDYPESYADLLASKLQNGTPLPYPYHESPFNTATFTTLSGASCSVGTGAIVVLNAGNYYFDCNSDVDIRGRLVIKGGTVVTKRGISVGAQGCFAFNVPTLVSPANCSVLVAAGDTVPPATKGAILYLRNGGLTKGGQGGLVMPRTFVYMNSSAINLGAGSGVLFWTNPRQSDPACDEDDDGPEEECAASRFSKLALWTDSTSTQSLGGQSALVLRGVVFTPKALFSYSGQPTVNQTNAQFWADRLDVSGQSGLTMAPDPNDAVPSPALGVALIR
jgi:Flp pilus assembly protein TadG